ncbi:MAG: HNH endonuclease [Promethearchaeota archaeon]
MNNREIVLNYLRITQEYYCDDCLSTILFIKPRQQINKICHDLFDMKDIYRDERKCFKCKKTKFVNKTKKNNSVPIIGKFYLNDEIHNLMKVSPQGGIRVSTSPKYHPNGHIVICVKPKAETIYIDHFDETGNFHCTGEGQAGNQSLTKGNKAIYESKQSGKLIFLFKKHNEGGKWEFMGQMGFNDFYTSQQPDKDGNIRLVYVFILELYQYPLERLKIPEIYREVEETDIKYSIEELNKLILQENEKMKKFKPRMRIRKERTKIEYQRSVNLFSLLKKKYQNCQICDKRHFIKRNDELYSEVHHIIPYNISHDDSQENILVICPNCHRKLHYAKLKERRKLYLR